MPRVAQTDKKKLRSLVNRFPGECLKVSGLNLVCDCCQRIVTGAVTGNCVIKRSKVQQHVTTFKHQKNKRRLSLANSPSSVDHLTTELNTRQIIYVDDPAETTDMEEEDVLTTPNIEDIIVTVSDEDISETLFSENESAFENNNISSVSENVISSSDSHSPNESKRLNKLLNEFRDEMIVLHNDKFLCQCCGIQMAKKKFLITQHVSTSKHLKNKPLKYQLANIEEMPLGAEFHVDLCRAFLAADIPLHKLQNPLLSTFIEKYTGRAIPDSSTIRKNYVPQAYQLTLDLIRQAIQDGPIWVSIGSMTDASDRNIINVVIGRLSFDEPSQPYLLNSSQVSEITASAIAEVFNESMNILWPQYVLYDRVLLLVTRDDDIMRELVFHVQISYNKLTHVTCVVDCVERIANFDRPKFSLVDELVAVVEKIFAKPTDTLKDFQKSNTDLFPLPKYDFDSGISFLSAAEYYADNFGIFRTFFAGFESDLENEVRVREILQNPNAINQLCILKKHYVFLVHKIMQLQEKGIELNISLNILKEIREKLTSSSHFSSKSEVDRIIEKNVGLIALEAVCNDDLNLMKNFKQFDDLPPSDLVSFKYAPIVSVDIDKTFRTYKSMLVFNRRNFLFENLKMHLIICCFSN